MKDDFRRTAIKRVMRWRYDTDLWFTRRIRSVGGETARYELRGSCNSCGQCCTTPMIHISRWLYHIRTLRRAIVWWHRTVNGFEHVGWDREAQAMIFSCTHYDPETHACDSYGSRPGMCRDYPYNLLEEPTPAFIPECSYYPYALNAQEIRESLDELELSAERRMELEKKFFIYEPDEDAAVESSD